MEQQNKSNRVLNIVLFLVMVAFLAYNISVVFRSGIDSSSGGSDIYNDMKWISLVVSLAGAIIGYAGINRASKGSLLRGFTLGFVIGIAALTGAVAILAP